MSTDDHFQLDLGHLAAFDSTPFDLPSALSNLNNDVDNDTTTAAAPGAGTGFEGFDDGTEVVLKELAEKNMNKVILALFTKAKSEGKVSKCELPPGITKLPRHRPIPEPKAETKWEKFAREKGIKKRKRERMVWDEQGDDYKPRWGYQPKKEGEVQKDWIVELKDGQDPTEDQFKKQRDDKKLRVLKNKNAQLRNIERSTGRGKKDLVLPPGLAVDVHENGRQIRGKGKGQIRTLEALKKAQKSTASLGKFDKKLENEPKLKDSRKKPKQPNESIADTTARDKKILQRVLNNANP